MKRFKFVLAAVMSLFLIGACSRSAPQAVMGFSDFSALESATVDENAGSDCAVACKQLRVEFRYIVYVGKQIYAYWDEKKKDTGNDFDSLAASLESSITDKTSDTDYFTIIRDWSAAFHDGHVNAIPRDDLSKFEIYSSPVRLQIYEAASLNEKVYVSELKSAEFDLKLGDQVLAINGIPIKVALGNVEK